MHTANHTVVDPWDSKLVSGELHGGTIIAAQHSAVTCNAQHRNDVQKRNHCHNAIMRSYNYRQLGEFVMVHHPSLSSQLDIQRNIFLQTGMISTKG